MKLSNFKEINVKDFLQGLIYALIAALLAYAVEAMKIGDLTGFNLKEILTVLGTSAIAYITYLGKRFLSNSDGTFLKPEEDIYKK